MCEFRDKEAYFLLGPCKGGYIGFGHDKMEQGCPM